MAEQSGFFNANLVNGEYDKVYLAEHFAKYFASFIGNGIFGGKSDELMVVQHANSGMKVELLTGMGWINGYWYENTSSLSLNISVADGVLNRIDNIVLRFGKAEREIKAEVIKGTPATNAVAPALKRDADYYDLKLAEIHVKAGTINITQAQIVDTRLNSGACGFVVGLLQQFDTTEFGKQLDGYISQYAVQYKNFLEEIKIANTAELTSLIDKLNVLAQDESALAALAIDVTDVASKTAVINQTLGYTKKNLIPYPFANSYPKEYTLNGITFTDNGDGTITANGTASINTYYTIYRGKAFGLGKFVVSSSVDINATFAYIRYVDKKTSAEIANTTYYGHSKTPMEIVKADADAYDLFVGIAIMKGTTVENLVFKPMVRRAEILDATWEPYTLSIKDMLQEDNTETGCFYRVNRFTGIKEWLNAPDKPGIEYCLTERWNGKPVYQKTFYAAALPNNSVMSIGTNTEWDKVVSVSGYAHDSDDLTYYPFPVILHNQITPIAVISRVESDGYIVITTNGDVSYLQAYITIKYTK